MKYQINQFDSFSMRLFIGKTMTLKSFVKELKKGNITSHYNEIQITDIDDGKVLMSYFKDTGKFSVNLDLSDQEKVKEIVDVAYEVVTRYYDSETKDTDYGKIPYIKNSELGFRIVSILSVIDVQFDRSSLKNSEWVEFVDLIFEDLFKVITKDSIKSIEGFNEGLRADIEDCAVGGGDDE